MKSRINRVKLWVITLAICIMLVAVPSPAISENEQPTDAKGSVLQQGAPPRSYGAGQVLGTFNVDLPECWHRWTGASNYDAWWTCADYDKGRQTPAKTADYVSQRVVSYNEFTVPAEGALLMEVRLEKDATHNGWLAYDIQRYDITSAKWVSAGWYWQTMVRIEKGKQTFTTNTQYDLNLLSQDKDGKPWHPELKNFPLYPPGKYRLSAVEETLGAWEWYAPSKGTFTIVFIPKGAASPPPPTVTPPTTNCPCTNKDLCKDSDGDGVLDWEDLCPLQKASLDKFGKPAHNGCPDPTSWLNALQAGSENYTRGQIKKFLSCQNTINADRVAQNLKFDYSGGDPEYNNGVLRIGGPMFKEFWRAEKEAECTGKAPSIKQGETIYGLLYHEMGHYIADAAGVANVTGAGGIHDPWKESNPGKAFDEGRADLIMNLMGRYFNRETKEEAGYGFAAYQSKIGPQNSNIVGDAVASTLIDLLPSDPCVALNVFMEAQDVVNKPPQNIQDWLQGYNSYIYDKYRRDLIQYVQADTKLGEQCKKYGIELPVGSLYKCVNPNGVRGVQYDANGKAKSFIIDSRTPNDLGFEGEASAVINFNPPLTVKPTHTDYEVKISPPGIVTVKANEGLVIVTTPDNRQVVVRQGKTYTYPETSSGGTGTGNGTDTGGDKGKGTISTSEAAIRDWDKANDWFGFARGGVCSGCGFNETGGDLFIADRGTDSIIHVFDSPGIIDMGNVTLDSVKEAPGSGYQEGAVPVAGHTYIVRSKGKYSKFLIEQIKSPPTVSITEYFIKWAYQPNGTRSFGTSIPGGDTWGGDVGQDTGEINVGGGGLPIRIENGKIIIDTSGGLPVRIENGKIIIDSTGGLPIRIANGKIIINTKGKEGKPDTEVEIGGPECFIATAAYGSETAAELDTLRAFRDKVLMKNELGESFVRFYYEASPPLAEFIAGHEVARTLVREAMLNPVVHLLKENRHYWNN